MLDQITIVLVETSHPGNIGSAARAMKTMGLSHLRLVSPEQFPHHKANELASGAIDILEKAEIYSSLKEAVADCSLVIGSSTRIRSIPWPLLNPKEMAEKIKLEYKGHGQIAILFGREKSGLSNEELKSCHFHVQIPANPEYSSLNVSQAVQVLSYELRMASLEKESTAEWDYPFATKEALEHFFDHLERVMVEIEFLKMTAPRRLMTRMRRLFLRAQPDEMEINMLRGFLKHIDELKAQ